MKDTMINNKKKVSICQKGDKFAGCEKKWMSKKK